MGGMMNAKRYTGCRCCVDPDDVARRQIEKREWKKEVEEDKYSHITPETVVMTPSPDNPIAIEPITLEEIMADPYYHAAKRQGYEWGVREERERIIALLEAEKGKQEHMWGIERDAFKDLVEIDWVIELIKGENE